MLRRLVALFLVGAVAPSVTQAAAYDAVRIDRDGFDGVLWVKGPPGPPRGAVTIVPGAQMTAERYTWLSEALVREGYGVVVVEAALEWKALPAQPHKPFPMRLVTIPHALAGLDEARSRWPEAATKNLIAIGHSLGASVVLELLDPAEAARNPNTRAPVGFAGVSGLKRAVILGSSLQAQAGNIRLPHRSEERPLTRPSGTRVLFIAAQHDAMAAPATMKKTAGRYQPAIEVRVVTGGNHLGWSSGLGPMDRTDLDGVATISAAEQERRTLAIILPYLARP